MGGVKEFVKDAALTAAAATALDLAVEAIGIPWLNLKSPIQLDPTNESSVIETILYGSGLVLTGVGALGVFAGKPIIPGGGKEMLAHGVGILAGTSFYENQIVKWAGIRNIRHQVYR